MVETKISVKSPASIFPHQLSNLEQVVAEWLRRAIDFGLQTVIGPIYHSRLLDCLIHSELLTDCDRLTPSLCLLVLHTSPKPMQTRKISTIQVPSCWRSMLSSTKRSVQNMASLSADVLLAVAMQFYLNKKQRWRIGFNPTISVRLTQGQFHTIMGIFAGRK